MSTGRAICRKPSSKSSRARRGRRNDDFQRAPPSRARHLASAGGGGSRGTGATYSVYTGYDTDENGEYTVVLGRLADGGTDGIDLQQVEIPSGPYLVFRAASPAPNDIQTAWRGVYKYFSEHTDRPRAYRADFDKHSDAGVELHIGVL